MAFLIPARACSCQQICNRNGEKRESRVVRPCREKRVTKNREILPGLQQAAFTKHCSANWSLSESHAVQTRMKQRGCGPKIPLPISPGTKVCFLCPRVVVTRQERFFHKMDGRATQLPCRAEEGALWVNRNYCEEYLVCPTCQCLVPLITQHDC